MLANGEAMMESCHHLRMMKPPEGEVLQLISAILFTDSSAPYLIIGISTIYHFMSCPYISNDLPFSIKHKTTIFNILNYIIAIGANATFLWHTTDPA